MRPFNVQLQKLEEINSLENTTHKLQHSKASMLVKGISQRMGARLGDLQRSFPTQTSL